MSHYDTLGVKRGCTHEEIRSAYRKLVLLHHPDRSKDAKSQEIFIRATEAYEVIGDLERRQDYDRSLALEEMRQAQAQKTARQATQYQTKPKPPAKKPETVAIELTKLVQLFSRGRILETETMARDLIRRAPREAIPYGVLGDILRSRGNLAEASKMYAYAAQFDPRNPVYQRRHEELLGVTKGSKAQIGTDEEAKIGPPTMTLIVAFSAGIYLVLSRETPLFPSVSLISTLTLGVLSVLFFTGIAAGASLSVGGWLDRFDSTTITATGRRSPTVALGFIAIANFWAAALLYLFIGLAQRSFNYSTSRVVGAVMFLTILFSACAAASYAVNAGQVLAWGGNLLYLGSLLGWMVADAFRR